MKGFAVIKKFKAAKEASKKLTGFSNSSFLNFMAVPHFGKDIAINGIYGNDITVAGAFQKIKVKYAMHQGTGRYGYVLSKDYGINYNPYFYYSCMVRGFDFLTVSLGCDMRFNEVVIADASTFEGKIFFRLMLPFTRRIILVTDNKLQIQEEVDYAIAAYGVSAAVVEDPVKASEKADAAIITSDKEYHRYIIERDIPVLFNKFMYKPKSKNCFNDVRLSFKDYEVDTEYAQGYVDVMRKRPHFMYAEKDGFNIKRLTMDSRDVLVR